VDPYYYALLTLEVAVLFVMIGACLFASFWGERGHDHD
jgi:hypothetical protein